MARLITAPGIVKNIDKYLNTMRKVPFAVAVSDWTASNDVYVATFLSEYISTSSFEIATYDSSIRTYGKGDIDVDKKNGGGGMVFTTTKIPTGTISGTLYVWDNNDNKVPIVLEDTTVPIENGGTGASNLVGAQDNLGITALANNLASISGWKTFEGNTFPASAKRVKILIVCSGGQTGDFVLDRDIDLATTDRVFMRGYMYTSQYGACITIRASKSGFSTETVAVNGATATYSVYRYYTE